MNFLRKSLYFKLLKVYGITFILLLMTLGLSIKYTQQDEVSGVYRKNFFNYAHYLARDIGNPPDIEKAIKLHHHTGLDVAVIGSDLRWSTSEDLLRTIAEKKKQRWPWHRKHILRVKDGGYTYYFSKRYVLSEDFWVCFFMGFIGVLVILYLSYRMTKKIFSPLDEMREAIYAFGEGKWNVRTSEKYNDEFRDLAATLNTMAEKIERHFGNMRDLLLAISHELRSPLTRMKLTLEFIPDEKIKNSLNDEINALDRITGMLLERERISARPELLEKTSTDLNAMIRSLTTGLDIQLDLQAQSAIEVDQTRFALAVKNIIDNAFKHGKSPVSVKTSQSGRSTMLDIHDSGEGLSREAITHLGEPFYRENKARTSSTSAGGYGLGLSLSYSIIKAHGFNIEVESSEGKGTNFRILMN